jgi:tRNA (guanine26-N2/guanine27-N2)-dimethyltransferase
MPIINFRSALLNMGYKVSNSHTGPTCFKTNAPNHAIWAIFREWHKQGHGSQLKEGTPGYNILHNWPETIPSCPVSFDIHPEANPASKSLNVLRYQMNPTKNWGPGVRNALDANRVVESLEEIKRQSESSEEDSSQGSSDPVAKKKKKSYRRRKEQKTVEEIEGSVEPMDT